MIDVRIGVVEVPKELTLEIDDKPEDVAERVNAALDGATPLLWLTDSKGKKVGIPVAKIAYVEIEPESGSRPVGFGV